VRLTATVPATSANLGPGFDCFGLALDLVNEVVIDTEGSGVTWEGEGADDLPTDGTDMITRSMAFVAHESGVQLPSFALHGVNRIPMERGLGSSSAAAVAGVLLVAHLLNAELGQDLSGDRSAVFRLASRVEGHPDNAAAAVYGGFTLVPQDGEVLRLDPHPSLRPVALIPETQRLSTADARRALASLVPRQDAIYNLSHAALMVVAMTERPDLLPVAMRDRLHQDARLDLLPPVRDVFDAVAAAGVPVAVSGSGPTLLALGREGAPIPDPGAGWRVVPLGARAEGGSVAER
jgi:homoserine kinase